MKGGGLLYGWYDTGQEWVKVKCDSNGYILVDTSALTFDILLLNPQSSPPTAVEGGVYYLDTNDSFYGGIA